MLLGSPSGQRRVFMLLCPSRVLKLSGWRWGSKQTSAGGLQARRAVDRSTTLIASAGGLAQASPFSIKAPSHSQRSAPSLSGSVRGQAGR